MYMLEKMKSFEESKFTYLSNSPISLANVLSVLKNQNLHISQTSGIDTRSICLFWRIKIYISLKHIFSGTYSSCCFEESKFTYLSNKKLVDVYQHLVLKNQNLHISQTCLTQSFWSLKFWRIKIYISLKHGCILHRW